MANGYDFGGPYWKPTQPGVPFGGTSRLMPPSYWGGTPPTGGAPSGGASGGGLGFGYGGTPAAGGVGGVGEVDITPVSETSPGIWLYSDGKYRDVWGLPEEGWSAEEAKAESGAPTARFLELEEAQAQADLDKTLAEIQLMLDNASQSGQMTEYDSAYMDYLIQKLEFDMQQAGIGDEQEWAQIDLQRRQVELQRNEWLAELQASPATWIERWQAERMPWGGQRIPLASDATLAAWSQPTSGGWGMPPVSTPPPTPPPTGGPGMGTPPPAPVAQPTASWQPTPYAQSIMDKWRGARW